MERERLLCSFYLEEYYFGLDVDVVQEVLRHQAVTRLPLAGPAVRGVINLRGRIVPALDLRRCLGLASAAEPGGLPSLVVRTSVGAVSLTVDAIGDVVAFPDSAFENTPQTVHGVAHDLIRGVFKLPDRLLLELDLDSVLMVAYA